MPKKAPKNSFSFFLDEYQEKQANRGRRISKKVAVEECSPLWKKLSADEKEKYIVMAKSFKVFAKTDLNHKYNSEGISLAELNRKKQKELEKRERMEMEIHDTVNSLAPGSSLDTHWFYIVHCNYYCITDDMVYVPAEIAISRFSLKHGVEAYYHTLIDPGCIPMGFAYEAKRTSDEVHGLPLPPHEAGEQNYFKIIEDIITFLEPNRQLSSKRPPMYTISESMQKAVENVLKELLSEEDSTSFRVYPLVNLFFKLKNRCAYYFDPDLPGFPVMANAETEMEKDILCYSQGISCDFHSDTEKFHNCSLGIVRRFAYLICDHCCEYLGVHLIPGRHCVRNADVTRSQLGSRITSRNTSRAPSTNGTSRTSSLAGDLDFIDNDSDAGSITSSSSYVRSSASSTRPRLCEEVEVLHPLPVPESSSRAFDGGMSDDASSVYSYFNGNDDEDEEDDDDDDDDLDDDDDDDEDTNVPVACAGRGMKMRKALSSIGYAA